MKKLIIIFTIVLLTSCKKEPIQLIAYFEVMNKDNLYYNKEVTFKNNTYGGPLVIFWNFGDGTTLNTYKETISHTYEHPGYYIVLLKAINNNERVVVSQEIRIK